MKKIILAILCINCGCIWSYAQSELRFTGGLHSDLNLSQIDGDAVRGYNRIGLQAGAYGQARLKEKMAFGLEFNYSQRGSKSVKSNAPIVDIRMNYLEVPVYFLFKDWKVSNESGKEYYKMHFMGGISFGRLFSSNSLTGVDKEFRNNDLSWFAGFRYFYARHWAFEGRYTRSLTSLRTNIINGEATSMISYFISLGLVYQFTQ